MVEKVLTTLSFIGGRLRQPGETVDFDDENPALAIPAPSSSLAQLSNDEIEAYLKRRRGEEQDVERRTSSNLADPTDENTGQTTVPIADVTVRSGSSGRPQGAPAGSVEVNGQFVAPAADGAASPVEAYVGTPGDNTGTPDLTQLDHDGDGKPGGSLTRDEMKDALDDRGIEYPKNATDDKLRSLLAEPPKA